jgi:hypothetical protein
MSFRKDVTLTSVDFMEVRPMSGFRRGTLTYIPLAQFYLISMLTFVVLRFQIWFHYDLDKSGYLEGSEIEVCC